ncbi:hypothetical protein ACNKHO_24455 [Shigella flexneri]
MFGIVHSNPDIVTNVYRDDEWFMNRHGRTRCCFFKEAVLQYSLYEPGLLDPEGIGQVFFTCESHEALLPLGRQSTPLGRSRERNFSTLTCLEVMAGGVSKGHTLEAVAKG